MLQDQYPLELEINTNIECDISVQFDSDLEYGFVNTLTGEIENKGLCLFDGDSITLNVPTNEVLSEFITNNFNEIVEVISSNTLEETDFSIEINKKNGFKIKTTEIEYQSEPLRQVNLKIAAKTTPFRDKA